MIDFKHFNSLVSVSKYFTDDRCKQVIIETRWPTGDVICPYCHSHHCKVGSDGRFTCTHCHRHFSEKVGTIFEGTKISLSKWFIALYLISSHKKGISSYQLAKDINTTQKTAYQMLVKIRTTIFKQRKPVLSGIVEVDEAYLGGIEKWKHLDKKMMSKKVSVKVTGRSTLTKTCIFGLYQRGGKLYTTIVDNIDRFTLIPIIEGVVKAGSTIMTDELHTYTALPDKYTHLVVNHKEHQYVDGSKYTNNVECFWSIVRRMLHGIYYSVSRKHLQEYLDEAVFRFNHRNKSTSSVFRVMLKNC